MLIWLRCRREGFLTVGLLGAPEVEIVGGRPGLVFLAVRGWSCVESVLFLGGALSWNLPKGPNVAPFWLVYLKS